jgi:tRNA-2-methylthio-N6-dimethylallyladenosine synthase
VIRKEEEMSSTYNETNNFEMIDMDKELENFLQSDKTGEAPTKEPLRQYYFMNRLKQWVAAENEKNQKPLKFLTQTFGCQMNAKDSEKLSGILETIGYVETDTEEDADFVVYNTCTVRENANMRVYGRLGYLNSLKRKNPNLKIALCGCMMQEDAVVDKIKKSYHFVDIIFGTHNIFKLAELMYSRIHSKRMVIDIWKDTDQIVEDLPSERKYKFKAGVNIMYGCNNFCSYCIVPYVRGRERSRNPEDIMKEIKHLVDQGVVEVMLLGQNVNSYGKTLESPMTFSELLMEIEKIEGLERVRFMTSHPKDLSDSLIEVMKDSKKICNHIHLPLQSGSTKILGIMNRKYTKEDYLGLVERIKSAMPNISLTTDIIVGFPGETEEDFLETLDVVRKARYDSAYTFLYSKRTGTPAAAMENQIEEDIAKERFNRLLKEIQEISAERTGRDKGTIQKALVEEVNGQDNSLMTGRLSNNVLVHFPGNSDLIGKIVNVHLKESKGFYYIGELV